MAGAFAAVTGDVAALEHNPAGLARLTRTDIALSYTDFLEGSSFQSAAVAFPFRATAWPEGAVALPDRAGARPRGRRGGPLGRRCGPKGP